MDAQERARLIQEHLEAIEKLRGEEAAGGPKAQWPPQGYYLLWHVLVGMVLGMIGATVSLMFNVVGSLLVGQNPLRLIQVYLTFPMGERALQTEEGLVLFVGCILYLVTGAIYGIPFHLILSRFFDAATHRTRFLVGSLIGLGLWVVNFYLLLSWLQPSLFGGNWIVQEVPIWVAALTHLVFAWTMLLVESWGRYQRPLVT
jgi:hypothetical protein